jgi:hypothetical protein
VARTGPNPFDNQFFLEHANDGSYGVYSMRKPTSDSTTVKRYEEDTIPRATSPTEVLTRLGAYFRLPSNWSHEGLKPYFTERRDI